MKETFHDLWFYAFGFFVFMSAAPVVAFQFPRQDPRYGAMSGIASLCILIAFVFLLMACAHAGKKAAQIAAEKNHG